MMQAAKWLEQLGLSQYARAFEENAVTMDVVPRLTVDDLKELGVTAVGHRRILLDAIALLAGPRPPAPARPAGLLANERRQVTVLFADLVGYTKLSAEIDAEEIHAILNAFFALADATIVSYGGFVDKHIGDCAMGVFGAPLAHHDDAERAVRAAIAIRDGLPAVAKTIGREINVHVGVASGEVLAAEGGDIHHEYTVTGETVNLASRLTDKATAGEVLVSSEVRDIVQGLFASELRGDLALKGFAGPLSVWKILGPAQAGRERTAPFVGRATELRQLTAALESCQASRSGLLIHVRGEPGIGKTRLIEEFMNRAAASGVAVLHGAVIDFGGDKGRSALAAITRKLMDVLGQASTGPGDWRDMPQTAGLGIVDRALIADLLDVPLTSEEIVVRQAMDEHARASQLKEAFVRLLRLAGQRGVVVAVLEDIQWAGSEIIDIVAAVAQSIAQLPVVLVVTSRVDWDAAGTGLRPGLTIDLAPLSKPEALALARSYFGPDAQWVDTCVDRAAGNPLFLDQLLLHVHAKAGDVVPMTIQSLVQARLDQLPAAEKTALQTASVLGVVFDPQALDHLLDGHDFDADLLVQRHLLSRREAGLAFTHALVRDGAYTTLPRERRRSLHARAAAWFKPRNAAVAAEHLAAAHDPSAPTACLAAAADLVGRFRYGQAVALIDRVLPLAAGGPEHPHLLLTRADALLRSSQPGDAVAAYLEAEHYAETPREKCRAWIGLSSARRMLDEIAASLADVERALTIAAEHDLTEESARALSLRANLRFVTGDLDGCWRDHQDSLALARTIGSAELEAAALGGIGDAEYARGKVLSAGECFAACVRMADQHDLRAVAVSHLPMHAFAVMWARSIPESLDMNGAAIEAARQIGHRRAEIIAHIGSCVACRSLQRPKEARDHAAAALTMARETGARRFIAQARAFIAQLDLDQGRVREAREGFAEALRVGREVGMAFVGPIILAGCIATAEPETDTSPLASEAEQLLRTVSPCHNHFIYRQEMIDFCLYRADWAGALRHADMLEAYFTAEPTKACHLIVARGRELARWGGGDREDRDQLEHLAESAKAFGMLRENALIVRALGGGDLHGRVV